MGFCLLGISILCDAIKVISPRWLWWLLSELWYHGLYSVAGGKVSGSPPHVCTVNQITQHDTAEDDNSICFLNNSDNNSFIITVLYVTLSGVRDVSAVCDSLGAVGYLYKSSGDDCLCPNSFLLRHPTTKHKHEFHKGQRLTRREAASRLT
jgi:hypothetical protein